MSPDAGPGRAPTEPALPAPTAGAGRGAAAGERGGGPPAGDRGGGPAAGERGGGPAFPPQPTQPEETGLPFSFVCDLILKILYFGGSMFGRDVARRVCLPWPMVAEVLKFLSQEGYCGTTGLRGSVAAHETFAEGLQYLISNAGRERTREILGINQYAGPAPVPLDRYVDLARIQARESPPITDASLRGVLQGLVLPESVLEQLGPGLISRQAIFLYGPPGNGKSSLAGACAALLGHPIFIPHALYVHGEVIRVFDPMHHRQVSRRLPVHDPRWVLCHRPVVRVGGELSGRELYLGFDRDLGFYEAPLQLKANGGLFLIDDFGRQPIPPRELLNRLIVPLEAGYDFLNIARAGTTVAVPFTEILILATNLDPEQLVDEAFLRRVRYKVGVPNPTDAQFKEILRRVCRDRGLGYDERVVEDCLQRHYRATGRSLHGCHPRDLVDYVVNSARYQGEVPVLSTASLDQAVRGYFASLGSPA